MVCLLFKVKLFSNTGALLELPHAAFSAKIFFNQAIRELSPQINIRGKQSNQISYHVEFSDHEEEMRHPQNGTYFRKV